MSAAIDLTFGQPSMDAVDALDPLFSNMDSDVEARVQGALYAGLLAGTNPNDLAGQLVDALAPSRAMTIARTEMLGAYREAANAAYRANSDVVGQWMWSAARGGACIACLEMDGEVFSLDEEMDGMTHPNCRCSPIPITSSWDDILGPLGIDASDLADTNILDDYETGDAWFMQQDAATQIDALGSRAAYEAVQAGEVGPHDFLGVRDDGQIYTKSLKEARTPHYGEGAIERLKASQGELRQALAELRAGAAEQGRIIIEGFRGESATIDDLNAVTERLFGRPLSQDELRGLVGGQPDSYVKFTNVNPDGNILQIQLHGPGWDPANPFNLSESEYDATRLLYLDDNGRLVMSNVTFSVDDALQGQGLGARIFADQVQTLSDLGVSRIETSAVGDGFYVWPRFGYEGRLPSESRAALREAAARGEVPDAWGNYRTIQQLMRTPEGRAWWKANGESLDLMFDLSDGSLSRRTLEKYVEQRQPTAFATSRVESQFGRQLVAHYDLTSEDKAFVQGLKKQIAALDQDSLTHTDVIDIGRQTNTRIEADLTEFKQYADEAADMRARGPGRFTPDETAWAMGNPDAVAAHGGLDFLEAQAQYQAEYQARVKAYLSEIRDFGGDINITARTGSQVSDRVFEMIKDAQSKVPSDWIQASNDMGMIVINEVGPHANYGGYFRFFANGNGQLAIDSNMQRDTTVSSALLHEMMHRMEQTIPRLSDLETDFYLARTAGETATELTNGIDWTTKLDDWRDPYIGRSPMTQDRPAYTLPDGRTFSTTISYELLSIGAEMLLGGGSTYDLVLLREDEEYVSFVLGVLASLEA